VPGNTAPIPGGHPAGRVGITIERINN